jgi:hypothetical protein
MKDKGPLIVALIVLAVILEVGLLATIDKAAADAASDGTPSDSVSIEPVAGEFMSADPAVCLSVIITDNMPFDQTAHCLLREIESRMFDNGSISSYYNENYYSTDHALRKLMDLSTFLDASWNFKSKWRVMTALPSFRPESAREVTLYAMDSDQAATVQIEYVERSALAGPERTEHMLCCTDIGTDQPCVTYGMSYTYGENNEATSFAYPAYTGSCV